MAAWRLEGRGLVGPTHEFEREARRCGYRCIVGLDEAGRGPLAGPVVAAAVWLPMGCSLPGLDDSKRLTADSRERLFALIQSRARAVGVGSATAEEIDRLNILEATRLAMQRALAAMSGVSPAPDFLLLDAIRLPRCPIPQRPIIKGDALSASIAAASIVAKVTRDRVMTDYHHTYPAYQFAVHKGYGTPEHLALLATYGPSPVHRRSFEPVRRLCGDDSGRSAAVPRADAKVRPHDQFHDAEDVVVC